MPNISIRDVPESIAEHLRQRAARHHRSLQGELMAILESAVAADLQATAITPAQPRPATTPRRTLGELADDLRRRLRVDVASAPSSTAIVREMRDTRISGGDA
jgi:plasmid stability protein